MKDLDFDELDRAVNSLITSTPNSNSNTDSDAPKENTLDLGSGSYDQSSAMPTNDRSVTSDIAMPVPVAPAAIAITVKPVVPTPPVTPTMPIVERPSTGRFMDVVHPSSNMRSNLIMPERNLNQVPELKPVNVPYPSPIIPVAPAATSMAAPINIMPKPMANNDLDLSTSDDDEDDDIDQIGNDIANALEKNSNSPLDSPFLSGAKVDKRPLGAFSNERPLSTPQSLPQEFAMPKIANNPSLPAELQDDLLLVESGDAAQDEEEPVNIAKPEVPSVPVVPIVPISPVTIVTQPVPAASITQQYKEQPSSGDQKTGAIYDTSSYHKALAPTKKKSGWLWVIWIVLLLVIGAGSGAAVYFLVLPNL